MTKTGFRTALVLSYAFAMLSVGASFAGEAGLPAPLREYLEREQNAEFAALDLVLLAVLIPFLMIEIVSLVALLKFWRWSRELAIVATALGVIFIPLLGPTVEPGISTALNYLSSMMYGAVIALAYFSPAAAWFRECSPAPPPFPSGGEAIGRASV